MRVSFLALAAGGLLTGAAFTSAAAQGSDDLQPEVSANAEDFLQAYYAKLPGTVSLPIAHSTPELSATHTISRIAFGSCNHHKRSQHMWAQIEAENPDLFLFLGDNNYGDQGWSGDPSLATLRQAYADMAETEEFTSFRSRVPMMVTWDDHDFGFNDGGANFAFRQWSETIFETFWSASDEVKARPGIYESRFFGKSGQRVQIIMLDTRFFRSDLQRPAYQDTRPPNGPYTPSDDASRTMLGDVQWNWLEQELAKPADLRIFVSSVQVLTEAHNWESWWMLPLERAKLYRMLSAREESGLVMLSGDRHAGGIYTDTPIADGEQMWELTSSSLNYSFSSTEQNTAREPDPKRLTDFISEENFGLVDVNWNTRTMTLGLRGSEGEVRAQQVVNW